MDNELFNELVASVKEMDKIAKGKKAPSRRFEFPEPEVKAIREKTGLSQGRFAMLIGVSKRTVENWEPGNFIRLNKFGPRGWTRTLPLTEHPEAQSY